MRGGRSANAEQRLVAIHPIGRNRAEPQDIAKVVAFLLSMRASFVTGTGHQVNGGYSAR